MAITVFGFSELVYLEADHLGKWQNSASEAVSLEMKAPGSCDFSLTQADVVYCLTFHCSQVVKMLFCDPGHWDGRGCQEERLDAQPSPPFPICPSLHSPQGATGWSSGVSGGDMDHGGLRSPMAEVGFVIWNGRCKRCMGFSPRKKHPLPGGSPRQSWCGWASGWELRSGGWKLSPSLGCYLGTFMDRIVLITTALKWSLISWILEVRKFRNPSRWSLGRADEWFQHSSLEPLFRLIHVWNCW